MPDSSAEEVLGEIEAAAEQRPVFVKDMAYQAADLLGPDLLKRFNNSFLVRDPAATLRSLAKRWPDFSDEEGGWAALDRAADVVESLGDSRSSSLDADTLCSDPRPSWRSWCDAWASRSSRSP